MRSFTTLISLASLAIVCSGSLLPFGLYNRDVSAATCLNPTTIDSSTVAVDDTDSIVVASVACDDPDSTTSGAALAGGGGGGGGGDDTVTQTETFTVLQVNTVTETITSTETIVDGVDTTVTEVVATVVSEETDTVFITDVVTLTINVTDITTATVNVTDTLTLTNTATATVTTTAVATVTAAPPPPPPPPPPPKPTNVCTASCSLSCNTLAGRIPPSSQDCNTIKAGISALIGSGQTTFTVAAHSMKTFTFRSCEVFFKNNGASELEYCYSAVSNEISKSESSCFAGPSSEGVCQPVSKAWQVGTSHA